MPANKSATGNVMDSCSTRYFQAVNSPIIAAPQWMSRDPLSAVVVSHSLVQLAIVAVSTSLNYCQCKPFVSPKYNTSVHCPLITGGEKKIKFKCLALRDCRSEFPSECKWLS